MTHKNKKHKSRRTIPHSRPSLDAREERAASKVIRSGFISQGEIAAEFEQKLAGFVGVKGAVVTNSGTSALHLGLMAMGIGYGDRVFLPSYVCSAPLNAVYMTGAEPVLCDIELESFNISAENIKGRIDSSVKAIIVPHMFGNIADMEKIAELGVPVVEDCAHAIGGTYGKRRAGSMGKFSILSFYANKMMACGEGGALLSDDEGLLRHARDRRDYDGKEDYKLRYSYKITDIQAAIGLVQLKRLPGFIRARKRIAARYDKAFKGLALALPCGEFDHIYHRYVVRVGKDLSKAISSLREAGIMASRPVFYPLNRYLELRTGFKYTDEAYSTALSLPIYPSLTSEEQDRVIKAVRDIFLL